MKAMSLLENSFINRQNEIILIPKNNTYFGLDNVETDTDFKVKLCEYFSRACCYDLVYKANNSNQKFYKKNTEIFNNICGTKFSIQDMQTIYINLGNGVDHNKAYEFVIDGFNLKDLNEENNENN